MNLLDLARAALAEQPSGQATPEQAAELRELIPSAFPGISDAEATELFAVARADPDAALMSFRALAADADRRTGAQR